MQMKIFINYNHAAILLQSINNFTFMLHNHYQQVLMLEGQKLAVKRLEKFCFKYQHFKEKKVRINIGACETEFIYYMLCNTQIKESYMLPPLIEFNDHYQRYFLKQ